nr:CBO0543 family protein [Ectobacillus ponti]
MPWGIWGRLVDKERRVEVFAYAMLFGMLAIILDVAGVNALLWGYPTKLFPIVPPLFPADVTLFPVVYSLLYQYGRTWSSYILYAALASCICAFMIEPACIWMGMYSNDHFPHWKSCIGFLLVAVMTKAIIGSLRTEDRKAAAAESQ